MTAIAIALAAALCWGVSDFGGGLAARRLAVPTVMLWMQGTGLLLAAIVVAASGDPFPGGRSVLFAALSGLSVVAGLGAFYHALSIGTMSIVAPISATGVIVAVVVGIAGGDHLTTLVAIGLVVAFCGVLLASREEAHEEAAGRGNRRAVAFALIGALAFGGWYVFSDVAADGGVPWLLLIIRVVPLPVIAAIVLSRGLPARPHGRLAPLLAACAVLDLSANGLYALATTKGALTIVSVIGSLYPVSTVLLARLVLRERITAAQTIGVLAAFAGVGLVSAG